MENRTQLKWPRSVEPVLVDNFSAIGAGVGEWAGDGGATGTMAHVADTVNVKHGTQSLKITAGDGTHVGTHQRFYKCTYATPKNLQQNGKDPKAIVIKVFIGSKIAMLGGITMTMYIRTNASNLKTFRFDSGSAILGESRHFQRGWNYFTVALDDAVNQVTSTGTLNWASVADIRLLVNTTATNPGDDPLVITWDSIHVLYTKRNSPGILTFSFDDSNLQQRWMADTLASYGWHGTFYNIAGAIDVESGALTTADIVAMYAAGHDMGVHGAGSAFPANWVIAADNGAQEIQNMLDYYEAHGMTRGKEHCSYPQGRTNDAVIAVLQAKGIVTARGLTGIKYHPASRVVASVVAGATTQLNLITNHGFLAGGTFTFSGMAGDANWAALNSSTEYTITAATSTSVTIALNTSTYGAYTASSGSINSPTQDAFEGYFPGMDITTGELDHPFRQNSYGIETDSGTSNAQAIVRQMCCEHGNWLDVFTHGYAFNTGGSTATKQALFIEFCNAVKVLENQGLLEVLSVSEVWARIGTSYRTSVWARIGTSYRTSI